MGNIQLRVDVRVVVTALSFLASTTLADISRRHVQLVTPAPFIWDEYGPTNPLSPDGSDYPCKIPHGSDFTINGTATEMVVGEEQTVRFSGWAVHGGGSCQFALTEGHAPTVDSAWKVIHSIEGGCPKANVTGNLEPGQDPDAYTFAVPEDFAPGDYTWAWTWVNRIAGEPEFYMNCAPVTVKAATAARKNRRGGRRGAEPSAAKASRSSSSYPDLFLANIGNASMGCDTSEAVYQQIAIAFPSPGESVSRPNGDEALFQQSCDGNPRNNGAATTSSATSSTSLVASTAFSTLTTSSSVATSQSVQTSSSPASSVSSVRTSSIVPSATATVSAPADPTSTATLDSPCTDGHLLCVGGTQFSTCTGGVWDAPQGLAANTTCVEEGESVGLDITYHWS